MSNQRKALGTAGEKGIVERAVRAGLRAVRQPLSGQLKDFPADVQVSGRVIRALVESKVRSLGVKSTGEKTLTLSLDWLRKVVREAEEAGFDHGALFIRPKGSTQDHFVLIEEAVYLDLLRRAR